MFTAVILRIFQISQCLLVEDGYGSKPGPAAGGQDDAGGQGRNNQSSSLVGQAQQIDVKFQTKWLVAK